VHTNKQTNKHTRVKKKKTQVSKNSSQKPKKNKKKSRDFRSHFSSPPFLLLKANTQTHENFERVLLLLSRDDSFCELRV
jgi:hypothetical protein